MTQFYVYGFVDRPLRPFTLDGHRVEVVAAASLFAAVERVTERPPLTEAFLRTQHQIVERLGDRAGAILPARFGAFVEDDELDRLATLRAGDFTRGLAHVTGRAQMTVRVLATEAPGDRARDARDPKSGTEYLRQRQAAATAAAPPIVQPLCAAVADIVVDARIESRTTPPVTTIVHLVPKAKASAYRRLIRQAARGLPADITLSISGPQPPFAFVPEIWP